MCLMGRAGKLVCHTGTEAFSKRNGCFFETSRQIVNSEVGVVGEICHRWNKSQISVFSFISTKKKNLTTKHGLWGFDSSCCCKNWRSWDWPHNVNKLFTESVKNMTRLLLQSLIHGCNLMFVQVKFYFSLLQRHCAYVLLTFGTKTSWLSLGKHAGLA